MDATVVKPNLATQNRPVSGSIERRTIYSAAVVSLLLFCAINWCFCAYARFAHLLRFEMSPHSSAWYAIKALQEHHEHVDLLLMGSSLVQRLIYEGEATYLNKNLDVISHRNSCELEDLLQPSLHRPIRSFSFAVAGLYVSDASLVTKTLLKNDQQPNTIVYGIAPRDFMDNWLPSPAATDTYKLINKIENDEETAYAARFGNGARFDFCVSTGLIKLFPMIEFRTEISRCIRLSVKSDTDALLKRLVPHPRKIFDDTTLIALNMLPEEFGGGLSKPFNRTHPNNSDNRDAYQYSYHPFRKNMYSVQKMFLEQLMSTCQKRHIQLILVNMPLRSDNYALMEPGYYDQYCTDIKKLSSEHRVSFIDMHALSTNSDSDYSDQVHLNGAGAVKFVHTLAPHLVPLLQSR